MITGEFLVADDLGPAGRLVAPGETLVLRRGDREMVEAEIAWVRAKMHEADRLLVKVCKLVPWREAEELDRLFDAMINWTPEAVKYGIIEAYLGGVAAELLKKGKTDIFVRSRFSWNDYNQVSDCVDFLRIARVEQLKKLLDFAFTDEGLKGSGNRIYLAVSKMSMSMRKQRA